MTNHPTQATAALPADLVGDDAGLVEPLDNAMVPRDVAESWKAKAENYQQERAELLAGISDMMASHVDNWPAPKKLKTAIALIDKTLRASRSEATELSARVAQIEAIAAKLAGALENIIERGYVARCIDEERPDYEIAAQALTEYKDATDGK